MTLSLSRLAAEVDALEPRVFAGRVTGLSGLVVEASGPAEALALGAIARIDVGEGIGAEIVGFKGERALLVPFDRAESIRPGARVSFAGDPVRVAPNAKWLGRVVNAFGQELDGLGPLPSGDVRDARSAPPPAHERDRVGARMDVGVRAINMFAAVCRGQRLGVFAGSGVGKSVLLSMLARYAAADVIVISLVGERGREVNEFIQETLGVEGLARSVVVVATSDEPAARRRLAPHTASAIAEHFRDQGKDVLLLVDSVTRLAMAQREIGLAAGEPPTTKGYTPSVFAELPKLLERAGPGIKGKKGSITGLFTVLVDGDDMNEPIADAVRGILDGHIVLERAIAERGRYPAINVLKSLSRLMPMCHSDAEMDLVKRARAALSLYGEMEELIRIGAYKTGADAEVDYAVRVRPTLEALLNQDRHDPTNFENGFAALKSALEI